MPFSSKAQRRKFYALKAQGKMSQKTIDEWEKETPAKIPERVMKKKAFLAGFYKRAAEVYVAPAQGDGTHARALMWNDQGGVDPRTPEDLDVAASVGLLTLPSEESGASCANCSYFRLLDGSLGSGFCTNPQVKQDVTVRMLCSVWEHEGSRRPYEDVGVELPTGQGMQGGQPSLANDIMSDIGGGAEVPLEEGTAPLEDEATPPQEKKSDAQDDTGNPRRETSSGPQKHTININVGHDKKAFLEGFQKEATNIHMILKRLGRFKKGTTADRYLRRKR